MVRIGDNGFVLVVAIAFISEPGECSSVERRRYYARVGKDLEVLAQSDFETMVTLGRFKEKRQQEGETAPFMKIVDTYLEGFSNDTNGLERIGGSEYVAEVTRNPLAMFRLIRRVAVFINSNSEGRESIPETPLDKVREGYSSDKIPLKEDLLDAAYAILRIHFMHNLSVSDLVAGNVNGVKTRTKLLAVHCLYIGLVAKFRLEFTVAIEWLKEAKRLARIDGTADVPTVQMEIIDTIKEHDKRWSRQRFTDEYYFMKPLKSLHLVERESTPSVRDVLQREYAGKGRNASYWPMNTCGLCSGENFHTAETSSHLFCWLEFKVNRIFTIGPLKMEFRSRNPDIVQIHQAFTQTNVREAMADTDASDSSNLGHMVEQQINQKVEAMTGLRRSEPNASDLIKVVNHVPGENEDIHVDLQTLTEGDTISEGDWIASFMIQLNEVEEGGYTAFPTTFATAVPNSGSAVFWFNTFSDGTLDFSTAHAHCPVVLGQKWAILKWIRFHDQFFVRKCSLNPKKRFKVLVNGKELPVPRTLRHKLIEEKEYENPKSLSVISEAPPEYFNRDVPKTKYAYNPSTALELAIHLDWNLYQSVKRVYSTLEEPVGMQLESRDPWNQMILRYMEDFNETAYSSLLQTNPNDRDALDKLAGNPLAAYRTFWRFENYVKPWITEDPQKQPGKVRQIRECIGKMYNPGDGPVRMDIEHAMTGILNLQFVYDLESDEIAEGLVAGVYNGIVLSARQCIEIGHHAIARGFYYQAINWMSTAVDQVTTKGDATVDLQEAEIELETAKKAHDRLLAKSTATERSFYVSPVTGLHSLKNIETRKQVSHKSYGFRNETEFADLSWIEVCQGKTRQSAAEKSKLFCWYDTVVHPYFKIGPLKVEIHSMFPKSEVVEYHEVLGEKLIAYLRNDSGRNFTLSTSTGIGATDTRVRISASFQMYKTDSEESRRILDLVTLTTGLKTGLEPLQLNSYGTGGHFASHKDSAGIDFDGLDAAVATFMFYVTEPEKGGGTAFAQAGAHIAPKAGSAILWYDTFTSGVADVQTFHGGCPVIFGEKRVATQFINYNDQNHLQCHGDVNTKFEVLVNGNSKYS